MEPAARPSVAQQMGADGSPSTSNAWQHPLRPTPPLVRPSPPSQEELRKWIQTEVASRLAPYERGLVAELPSNLARGLSGRRDSGPRIGGYSEYSQYSQYPDYPSLDQYFTQLKYYLIHTSPYPKLVWSNR